MTTRVDRIMETVSDYPGGVEPRIVHEDLDVLDDITERDAVTTTLNYLARAGKLIRTGPRRKSLFRVPEALEETA